MICKDCLHCGICNKKSLELKNCLEFKDRSKFVELPCKVGDTMYYIASKYDKHKKTTVDYVNTGIVSDILFGKTMIPHIAVFDEEHKCTIVDTKEELGKIAFFTKEEAEQALKGESEQAKKKRREKQFHL